jgi:hypothetical protein
MVFPHLSKVLKTVEVSVSETRDPGAAPEFGDLSKVEIFGRVDRLSAHVDDFVENERFGAQPIL